jgi:hypothetical protein
MGIFRPESESESESERESESESESERERETCDAFFLNVAFVAGLCRLCHIKILYFYFFLYLSAAKCRAWNFTVAG